MGFGPSKKKIISNEEIDKTSTNNVTLERLFLYYKGYDGYIYQKDFEYIFQRKVDFQITKKLYKIFSSEKEKFFYEDLKYMYASFLTRSYNAKINLISELIFNSKSSKTLSKYKDKVNMMFGKQNDLKTKLLSTDFLKRICEKNNQQKILRENFIKNLSSVYENYMVNFEFIKTFNTSTKIKYKYGAKNTCICDCYFSTKLNKQNSCDMNEFIYDKMESEFRRIEKMNDGVFAMNVFEKMLLDLEIHEKLVTLISLYLKRKYQKNFIDFKNFKSFLLCFIESNDNRIKMLFEIIAYPRDYIEKTILIKFLNNFGINQDIKDFLEEKISKISFLSLFTQYSLFSHIINSLERINYIPFIFFKLRPDEKSYEKMCIQILTKGEKNIANYINNILTTENEFYCLNNEFWVNWCNHVEWEGEKMKNSNDLVNERNNSFSSRPSISNDKLLGRHQGQINPSCQYLKDFVVLPYKIYDLFTRWYVNSGVDIKFKVISYQKKQKKTLDNRETPIQSFHQKIVDDKIYEIDFNPIFLKYFSFEEIFKNINTCSLDSFKDLLKNLNDSNLNLTRVCSFSRVTSFLEIKMKVEGFYKLSNVKSNLWIYYKSKFFKIENLQQTLEELNVDDFFLIVIELMKDNKWQSEILESGVVNKSGLQNGRTYDNSLIGISNIGNTCYMNSVLQILLNLKELREILMTKNFGFCINYSNKFGFKGRIIKEFLRLMEEKWGDGEKDFKPLRPLTFKEQIGEINEQFKNFEQQDAQEFFNFLLDVLHEELNLKSYKEYIANPEKFDYSPSELSDEYWANNMRRNASFIHSLFLGQLESKLICANCNSSKTTYETFTNLVLPVSQKKKIFIEVVFFRLPFVFKSYYFEKLGNIQTDVNDIKQSLIQLRKQSYDSFVPNILESTDDAINAESSDGSNPTQDHLKKNPSSRGNNMNLYSSRLATSIPIKIIFEIETKYKVEKIISQLKEMRELELEDFEENSGYFDESKFSHSEAKENIQRNKPKLHSSYVIMSGQEGNFIDPDLKIDECFQNNQTIYVYELINTIGIEKILTKNKDRREVYLGNNLSGLTQSKRSSEMISLTEDTLMTNPQKNRTINIQEEDKCSTQSSKSSITINNKHLQEGSTPNYSSTPSRNSDYKGIQLLKFDSLSLYKLPNKLEQKIENENLYLEYLVSIIHRYPFQTRDFYLFRNYSFNKLDFLFNMILVNNKENFNARFLYDYIWEKFEYVLNNSFKIKSFLWWQKNEEETSESNLHDEYYMTKFKNLSIDEIKYCCPFVIKILDKEKETCIKCPWYSFCTGCILDPFSEENIIILPSQIIMVEWCYDIVKSEMNEANLRLILNHNSVKNKEEDNSVKTLEECISLFLEKEYLDGQDQQIYCSSCKSLCNFYKKFDFDKMPPILILSVKRFKFAKLYKKKIDNLIQFPLYDLNLAKNSYDLFGVVNHSGILSAGHYTATIKVNNKWIKCDDSSVYEVDENSIVSPGAYILIYKLKGEINTDYFNLMNLILNNLDIQITNATPREGGILHRNSLINTIFLPGEPVSTAYGRAYVIKEILRDGIKIINVKYRYGQGYLNVKSIKKEVFLDYSCLDRPPSVNTIEKKKEKEIQKEHPREEKSGGDCYIY